jgi:hypothetical protein
MFRYLPLILTRSPEQRVTDIHGIFLCLIYTKVRIAACTVTAGTVFYSTEKALSDGNHVMRQKKKGILTAGYIYFNYILNRKKFGIYI